MAEHRCQRCGASCQGLRVRVQGAERDRLARVAASLGVERPFSGDFLRQNFGVCVFYDQGCRIHAAYGAAQKPEPCRRFPSGTTLDPACYHLGDLTPSPTLPGWEDLTIGDEVRVRLRRLPLVAVCTPQRLGPLTAAALTGLDRVEPVVPVRLDRINTLATLARPQLHHPDAARLLVGGGQLLAGAAREDRFAAWVRLLRVLPAL